MASSSSLPLGTSNSTHSSPIHPDEQLTPHSEPTPHSEQTKRSQAAYARILSSVRSTQTEPFGEDLLSGSAAEQSSHYQLLGSHENTGVDFYDLAGFDSFSEEHKMSCARKNAQDTYAGLDDTSKQKIHMTIWNQLGAPREVDPMNWNQREAIADLAMFSIAFNSLSEEERNGLVFKYEVNSSPSFASSSAPIVQDGYNETFSSGAGMATVDHVATLPSSIDHRFIATMEPPKTIDPDLFTNLRTDLETYGKGEATGKKETIFQKNARQLINFFEAISEVIARYDNNTIKRGGICKEIKGIAINLNMGLHLEEFDDPTTLIEMIRGTLASVQIAYVNAKANNMLPVFFIAGLGNGSCYNTRTEIISMYSDATHCGYRQEETTRRLLEFTVITYASRENHHKLPVDFDKFHRYLTGTMGLNLEYFGISNENPRENPIVKALTISGKFSSDDDGKFFEAIMEEYTYWPTSGEKRLLTKRGDEGYTKESRAAFRQLLIRSQENLLTEVNEQNVDTHIDNFIRLNRELLTLDLGEPIDEAFAPLVSQLFNVWRQSGEQSLLLPRDKNYFKENRAYFRDFLLNNESIQRIGIDKNNINAYIDNFIREDRKLQDLLGIPADEQRISADRRRRSAANDRKMQAGGAQTSSSSSSGRGKGRRGGRFQAKEADGAQTSFSSSSSSGPGKGRRGIRR